MWSNPATLVSALDIDIAQHWVAVACVLLVYFFKEKIFDEVAITKFLAQRRMARCSAQVAVNKIRSAFPTALTNRELVVLVRKTLKDHGFRKRSTKLATSFCRDDTNRGLEKDFAKVYGDFVPMGGLTGFAFGGVRSFGELTESMSPHGDALIVYGPHVGVNTDGAIGRVNVRGRDGSVDSCPSATKAAKYVSNVRKGLVSNMSFDEFMEDGLCVDMEQYFVQEALMPYGERLDKAEDLTMELPLVLYDAQDEVLQKVVLEGCEQENLDGFVALLGGVQINTPPGVSDYFLPLRFELRDKDGQMVKNLMW